MFGEGFCGGAFLSLASSEKGKPWPGGDHCPLGPLGCSLVLTGLSFPDSKM